MTSVVVHEARPLSARQVEILRRLASGETQKQIARALDITEHAVRSHLSAAYGPLGVTNAAQAVAVILTEDRAEIIPLRPAGRPPEPLPPFAGPYLHALDRHLADGNDDAAKRDLGVAAIGLTARKHGTRDRDAFLDRVIDALGLAA